LNNLTLQNNINAFAIKSATILRYTSAPPTAPNIVVDITILEAYHSDDAFGLMTSMMSDGVDSGVGSLSSFTSGDTPDRICWQGDYYFHSRATNANTDTARNAVDRLIARLVLPIGSKDLPTITNYLPTAGRINGKLWVSRKHLNTLPEEVQQGVLKGLAVETTKTLGLDLDTLMVITAYDVGIGEKPNFVWLVRYPTSTAAREAYSRYDTWRSRHRNQMLISVEKPTGRFLCGSWTADQESIKPMVPEILSKLPKS